MSDARETMRRTMWATLRRYPACCAATGYVLLSALATWPLLGRLGSELAGGRKESWQALWGLWWWHDSVRRGVSPFHCDVLQWPRGVELAVGGWNLPAALAIFPLWGLTPGIPEVALYNVGVLLAYAFSGLAVYLLCRDLWGEHLGPFLAGALYAVGGYHFGYALGQLNVASIAAPVYFLGLVRTVRRRGPAAPLVGGLALALTVAASPGHLAVCAVGTVILVSGWYPVERATLRSHAFLHRALLLAGTFLVLDGWLLVRLLRGGRDAAGGPPRGLDLLAFLVPDGASALGALLHRAPGAGAYVGYALAALALAAVVRTKAARPWAVMAAVGVLLALGPRLEVAGHTLTGAALPFAWLDALGAGRLGAAPGDFAWLVAFGATVAAGALLAHVVRAGGRGPIVACLMAGVALAEGWPDAMSSARWPAPRFLRDLARDGERWAVLDATPASRQLWNQLLHRHPQVGVGLAGDASRGGTEIALLHAATASSARGRAASAREAVKALQQMNVRFVIADEATLGAARALRLPSAYEGDGLVIFEVPPSPG